MIEIVDDDIGRNSLTDEDIQNYVKRIEAVDAEIDQVMADAKEECQPKRDAIKDIKNDAAESGLAKKVLSAKLRERKLARKQEAVRAGLNEKQKDEFDEITFALGDLEGTPLGDAAQKVVEKISPPEVQNLNAGDPHPAEGGAQAPAPAE